MAVKKRFFYNAPKIKEPWEEDWEGMPEFVQKGLTPYSTIYVHFRSEEDLNEFAKLIRQILTPHTKSIWYPKLIKQVLKNKMYVDES